MRKKKHGADRLAVCEEYIYKHTGEPLADPSGEVFDRAGLPVYLEIGAGKGGFAVGMMKKHGDVCYFAMERVTDCVVLAAERAVSEGIGGNLKFVIDTADNLTRIFSEGTVDRIFLNFSDPWSKKGYAKRRLTHRRYLSVYMHLLKPGGKLRFKTDNVGLFDFTLEELSECGLKPNIVTRDLHSSEWMEDNVITEYEANFSSMGLPINMLEVTRPDEISLEIPIELSLDRIIYKKQD
jgi:tRNA (guanine-N7-)-methyltransferase